MCRWLAYSGAPLPLEELILKPEHSLIDQSIEARLGENTLNGDGFGIGWYGDRETPGVYKGVQPAWNDSNLGDLAAHISSRLFFAHIRATTGTAVQQSNCHPFRNGKWLFVHNGLIQEFHRVKRDLALAVDPDLYPQIAGTTDSELMFFLARSFGLDDDPVAAIARMVGYVEKVCADKGIADCLQMSVGLSDGARLFAFRYSTEGDSRSLFHSRSIDALKEINPQLQKFSSDARVVVSEPLSSMTEAWQEVPESSVVIIQHGAVNAQPFAPVQADA